MTHRLGCGELTDGVETCVGAKFVEHQSVVVTDSAIVELLCPACFIVHNSHLFQEGVFILTLLFDSRGGAGKCLVEDGVNLLGCVWLVIELFDAVVREFAAF